MKHKLHLNLPKDIFALLTNRLLFRLGFGLIGVFLPIFFYKLFDESLYILLIIYISIYVLGILWTPISSMLIGTLGVRKMLLLSVPPSALSIGALYYANAHPVIAVTIFVISISLYRALYWVPFQTDLTKYLVKGKTGANMAVYINVLQAMNAATPLIGGLLITAFGFSNIFAFAALVLFTTLIPTYFIVQVYERYAWGYFETFKHLFNKGNRGLLYAYIADGAQSVVTIVVWPIFIFEILDGNLNSIGFVTSLTIIVIMILNVVVGKFIDKIGEDKMLRYSTILATTGWIVKVFVDSAFQIFITDTYHRLGRAANRMSFDSATYEHAADNGHFVDEFTTLKEIALNIGRILMLLVVGALVFYFDNIRIVFIIAAGATLFMVMLNRQLDIK